MSTKFLLIGCDGVAGELALTRPSGARTSHRNASH
jgi:hypothetical protein